MAEGKWISGLQADLPVTAAAERVLQVRLNAVLSRLPRAAHHAHEDIEHVHQLRVATRRARAALDLFRDCLPAKFCTRVRRTLRRLRRAAGAARDCDVFLLRLQGDLKPKQPRLLAGLHWVSGQLCARRSAAQADLQAVAVSRGERLEQFLCELYEKITSHAADSKLTATLGARAATVLSGLLTELEAAADCDLHDFARLHQVRIAGKRLRYALEVFIPVGPAALKRDLYPRVEAMQELLGHVNDHVVAIETLEGIRSDGERYHAALWPVWQPGVTHLLRLERRRLSAAQSRFLKFWSDWRRVDVFGQFRAATAVDGSV